MPSRYDDSFLSSLIASAAGGNRASGERLVQIAQEAQQAALAGDMELLDQLTRVAGVLSESEAVEEPAPPAPIGLDFQDRVRVPRQPTLQPEVPPPPVESAGTPPLQSPLAQAFGSTVVSGAESVGSPILGALHQGIAGLTGSPAFGAAAETLQGLDPNFLLDKAAGVRDLILPGAGVTDPLGIGIPQFDFSGAPTPEEAGTALQLGVANLLGFDVQDSTAAAAAPPPLGIDERMAILQGLVTSGMDPTAASAAMAGAIDLGPTPDLEAPPSPQLPPPADFGPVRERLEEAQPEANLAAGTLAGLASGGMAGLQHGRNFGEALLMAGLGGLGGLASAESDFDRAMQSYNLAIAQAETGLIQAQQEQAVQRAQVQYEAALQKWEFDAQVAQSRAPRFAGFQNGVMLVEETDPNTGNRILRWDANPAGAIAIARRTATATALGGTTVPLVPEGLELTRGDPLNTFKEITAGLHTAGQIPALLGEETWVQEYLEPAQEIVNTQFGGQARLAFEAEEGSEGLAVLNIALTQLAADLYEDAGDPRGGQLFERAATLLRPDIVFGVTGGIGGERTAGSSASPAGGVNSGLQP